MTPSQRRCVPPPPIVVAKPIELRAHGDFVEWLAASGGSLAVTTYNSGKLAFFSASNGVIAASFWHFPRPMGLAASADRLALGCRDHLWSFRIANGQLGVDAVYWTGRLDAHDLAFDRRGLMFANTRFNCIARPSDRVNFLRTWQPPFVAAACRQDCCHLNGIGIRSGRLTMATAFCESDAPSAWREGDRHQSGVLIDIRRGEVAARGLCMPHSPRWHDGRWWFCNSGEGALCSTDQAGAVESRVTLPGFTRGLAFAAGRGIIGLSRIRKRHILDAPPVRERFARLRSGVWLVDSKSGRPTGALEFTGGGREVYDVVFLARIERPEIVQVAS
jgi:uncharacterized protein (TIGR03032 family)